MKSYSQKSPIHPLKSPVYPQKSRIYLHCCVNVSAKGPYIFAKEPCMTAKEPCMTAKEPCITVKNPCIYSKEPYISAKEPYILTMLCERAAHRFVFRKRALYICKRALYTYSAVQETRGYAHRCVTYTFAKES